MTVRRTAGACAMALGMLAPSVAMPQEPAQDLTPFVPPPCVAGQEMFPDVPASNPFCPWIEQLVRDHITGGCGPQLYCPAATVTRAQMAVFLELAMRGTDTWTVDAGLLDGMDSTDFVSAVNAGTGLSGGGSGGSLTVSLADSFRLPQTCAGGQHPEWTGTAWICGSPGAGTVTSVATGAGLTGGPITTSGTIAVAPGGITSAMVADGAIGSADVADGSIGASDVTAAQVQLRVTPPCAAGEFVRAVNADGTPVCAADADSGGTVTSVATGAGLTGGPITGAGTIAVAVGGITSAMVASGAIGTAQVADGSISGADVADASIGTADIADGAVGAADVAAAQVQLRVAAPCAAGEYMRAVNADGTVACAPDLDSGGTVTSVATGAGLTGGPITGSGTVSVAAGGVTGTMIADGAVTSADVADGSIGAADVNGAQIQVRVAQGCTAGQSIRVVNTDGTVVCEPDDDSGGTLTSVATGPGLTGGPITGSGTVSVAPGGITSAMVADGAVGSADIADGSIAAADVNSGQVQLRIAQSCPAGAYLSAINGNGSVQCASDAAHSHFGQQWTGNSAFNGLTVTNSGTGAGLHGASGSTSGEGVRGEASATAGTTYGVYGVSASTSGNGVWGEATATSGMTFGVVGVTASPTGRAVEGRATSTSGQNFGVQGLTYSSSGAGLAGAAYSTSGENYGVFGHSSSPSGWGGYFSGRAYVTSHLIVGGSLSVSGTKNFRIDHPLDPANRYLVHAAIESDEMLNMYSGTVVLDVNGTATVRLPDWFEALNRDFRYQLTCVGGYAPVYIGSEIQGGRFAIAGGRPGLKVSWQVVGTRSDAHALAHPMAVEEEKPADERGTYLDPEAHGMPVALRRDYKVTTSLRQP